MLVHCYEGRGRAPTALATALARLREVRPIVDPPESLRELGREVVDGASDGERAP